MTERLHRRDPGPPIRVLVVGGGRDRVAAVEAALDRVETAFLVRCVATMDDVASHDDGTIADDWPDCVLLDLGSHEAEEFGMLDRLIAGPRHPALVVVMGRADRDLGVRAIAHGAHDVVVRLEPGQVDRVDRVDQDPDGRRPRDGPHRVSDELEPALLERTILHAVERRRLQIALERSEERHRSLVDLAPAGILFVDRDGRITFANDRLCEIIGIDRHEVAGAMPADLVAEHHADEFAAAAARLATGEPGGYDLEVHRRDGQIRWVNITSKPFVGNAGFEGALVVAADITERRRAYEQVRFQAALLEAVGEAVIATDPDGTVVFWNAAAERLYGWTADEAFGRSTFELTPAERSAGRAAEIMAALRRGESWSGEFEVRRKDGSSFAAWVSDSPVLDDVGELVAIIGVSVDISQRVSAEQDLEVRAVQQTAVAEVAAFALSDAALGSLLQASVERAVAALGATAGELVLRSDDGSLRLEATHDVAPPPHGLDGVVGTDASPERSFGAAAVERNTTVVDLDVDPAVAASLHDRGITSGVGVVMRVEGEPVGALCVLDRNQRSWSAEDITTMQSIADLVASAIHRRRVMSELDRRAVTDELTDLPNRAAFLDRLGHALERRSRYGGQLAVLFADLDRFKDVNDAFGHPAGDRLICAVGHVIADAVRAGDTVARFGGDEFAVLCEPVDDAEQAVVVAERITSAVAAAAIEIDGRQLSRSVSVGIAMSNDQARTSQELLRDADAAMYRAKAEGGDRAALFDLALQQELVERFDLTDELRAAIAAGQFEVHYQPEVALDGSGVVWVEALVRWRHPERGVLPPAAFIDLAEETGLIRPLGGWVLETAVAQFAAWRERSASSPASISVNLSAQQLLETGLIDRTRGVLDRHGLARDELWFELTETSLVREPDRSLEVLHGLRELGVGLAIDDFGTGYASLAYAQRLPVDALKIDRSFVDGMLANPRDAGIVRAVVEMARSFGILAIAEGVESHEHLDALRDVGCHFAQGYVLSRPMPADAVPGWIAGWHRGEVERRSSGSN